jgi:nicotinamide-nucleotide amidase
MRTEILNIGDELLIGQVVNTNAAWMSNELDSAGFPVNRITVIRDDREEILNGLTGAESRSDIVVVTGGLGPTKDDITKDALCQFFGTKLVFDQKSFENVSRIFRDRGFPVTELNRKQAEIPGTSVPLLNKFGTAPGMWFEKNKPAGNGNTIFVSLPGVPYEMKHLLRDEVIPRLKERFTAVPKIHRTVLTQGIGESFLSDILQEWETSLPPALHLAYLPQPGIVRLRLTASGADNRLLNKLLNKETEKLYSIIPQYIYGEGEETLEEIIGKLLTGKKSSLSIAESMTGGAISQLITRVPGSSKYFKGSIVAYANEVKMDELSVSEESLSVHGAVSEVVVTEMALGIQKRFGTDWAIATSGIAGPDGATPGKPVGTTWIAIATPSRHEAFHFLMGDDRERNIRKTALQALNLLRKAILEEKE